MTAVAPLAYEGEIIHERAKLVSLTDMWRAARDRHVVKGGDPLDFESKRPTDWLSLTSTQEFVVAVEAGFNAGNPGIETFRGGRAPGTWAHWQIGLAYAKYLDHDFHMWANSAVRDRMERRAPAEQPAFKLASEALRLFLVAKRVGRALGFDDNQAALNANRATIVTTGVDALSLLGATHLIAPQQERHVTATELGERIGSGNAKLTNLLMERTGFQISRSEPRGRTVWEPTEKGRPFAVFLDTGKRQFDGTPVRQLRWSADIIPHVQAAIAQTEPTDVRP